MIDKTRHYYTLCRAASPVDTPPCGTPKKQNGNGNETPEIVEDEGCQPEMEYEDEFEIENQEAATHPATSIAGKNSVNVSSKNSSVVKFLDKTIKICFDLNTFKIHHQ